MGAIAATLFAEHSPGLEVSDGAFHGSPHLAEGGVELDLAEVEAAARESFEGHRFDSVDADIA